MRWVDCGKEILFAQGALEVSSLRLSWETFTDWLQAYSSNLKRSGGMKVSCMQCSGRICKIYKFQTHQTAVGAEKLDFLRDAEQAVGGWMRQAGSNGKLNLGVVLIEL